MYNLIFTICYNVEQVNNFIDLMYVSMLLIIIFLVISFYVIPRSHSNTHYSGVIYNNNAT
jgi:hypothetical protein